MAARSRPAATGEINAIAGYKAQYDAAVYYTLRQLREMQLKEVRLANLDAGQVDDIILVLTTGAVHAYQVKDLAAPQTYNDFTKPKGLLSQMAAGWQKLQTEHHTRDVVVHLVTDQELSDHVGGNVKLPMGKQMPQHPHFRGFWEEVWQPYQDALRAGQKFAIPSEWEPAFQGWKQATLLTDADFEDFARAFSRDPIPSKQEISAYADITHLANLYYHYQTLVEDVKRTKRPANMNAGDINNLLGLQQTLLNAQDFPVSAAYYPIQATVDALTAAIHDLSGGYLAIIGTPGSGKSSLLTRTLVDSDRSERIIRYYCFRPGDPYGAPPREEATSFLNDLVVQLESLGFRAGTKPPDVNLDRLRTRFGVQLNRLGDDYAQHGTKTLLLIDGLDYVTLDETAGIIHPLVGELPAPHQIPDGVLIVLGTQHLNDVPVPVREHVAALPQRQIQMARLDHHAVVQVARQSGAWDVLARPGLRYHEDPASERVNVLFSLSEGHPLAVEYALSRLAEAATHGEDMDAALDTILPHHGNIYEQYALYWEKIDADDRGEYAELAGLLARIRRGLDFAWMEQWDMPIIASFQRRFLHFFRKGWDGRHYFFHDSFRRFLSQRSIETPDGSRPERDKLYHRKLAERCEREPADSPHHWDTLYHRWHGGEPEVVLNWIRPDYFEQQRRALRPLQDIIADVSLAAKAAAFRQNPVLLLRALLLLTEYDQRFWNYSEVEEQMLTMLIEAGDVQTALSWSVNGERLRSGRYAFDEDRPVQALRLCGALAASSPAQARDLFFLVEPVHLLRRQQPLTDRSGQYADETLDEWAEVVAHFRPLDDIVANIQDLRWADNLHHYHDWTGVQITQHRRHQLLARVLDTLLAQKRWDDVDTLLARQPSDPVESLDHFDDLMNAYAWARNIGETSRADAYRQRLLAEYPPDSLQQACRVVQQEWEETA